MMKVLLLTAMLLSTAMATLFQDCGSKGSGVTLEVEGCDTPPCVLRRGDSFPMTISFTSDHDVSKLTAKATAEIAGIQVPWPGFHKDACSNLADGQSCPIAAGSPVTWNYMVDVLRIYPKIKTVVTFKLKGDHHLHLEACVQVPVTIV